MEARNEAGWDAAGEAERAGREEVVGWLLGVLDELDGGEGEVRVSAGVGANGEAGVEEGVEGLSMGDVEAEGGASGTG